MLVPVNFPTVEISIKGSKFLAEAFSLESQAQAREILKSQKAKYADATHVCHAFICGKNAEFMGMSDDGEPGGTAGRPMLDVLKGSGATNLMVTVTRWFGGTLLGTGGLVKAYSQAVKDLLAETKFEELVEKSPFSFETDYSFYKSAKKILEGFSISELKENFSEGVRLSGMIPSADYAALSAQIFDKSNGRVKIS